ncbi:SNED1-like protein [Mya arenaria]|uniref:SNED1-like protein n=1 Tax=Mya arenaria TaxID=6604 RepID=A0ABY7FPW9_MYAAR|nr:SNED1-like protein [Mya arenaria]
MSIGAKNARIGYMSFGDNITHHFYLNTYDTTNNALSALRAIRNDNIPQGIEAAVTKFTTSNGDRSSTPNYLLLITDIYESGSDTKIKEAIAAGIHVTVLVRGPCSTQYQALADECFGDLSSNLEKIKSSVLGYVCHHTQDCGELITPDGTTNGTETLDGTVRYLTCNAGYQQNGTGLIRCESDGAWNITSTCIDIDECQSGPCRNSGSCIDFVNYYECSCTHGYTGYDCAIDCGELVTQGGSANITEDSTVKELTCTVGYTLHGTGLIYCEEEGGWNITSYCVPNVDEKTCSGLFRMYRPRLFICDVHGRPT